MGADGTCAATGRSLLVKDVSDADRAELCSVIPRLIGSRAKGAEFRAFADYVRERGPFEYVIDGANIGFYGQGKAVNDGAKAAAAAAEEADLPPPTKAALHEAKHARFLYPQLDALLRAVCARSQRVLLVLHVSHTKEEEMDPVARELVLRWRQAGVLFTSPAGHNDDWYWLYAAMASGRGCRVVSNDEMRDHHFGMLAPRSFLRWKERHVVHFAFPRRAGARARVPAAVLVGRPAPRRGPLAPPVRRIAGVAAGRARRRGGRGCLELLERFTFSVAMSESPRSSYQHRTQKYGGGVVIDGLHGTRAG